MTTNTLVDQFSEISTYASEAQFETQFEAASWLDDFHNQGVDDFFEPDSGLLPPSSSSLPHLVARIQDAADEAQMTLLICALLNTISADLWGHFKAMKFQSKPIIFSCFAGRTPKSWGSREHSSQPNFGCFRGNEEDFARSAHTMPTPPDWPLIESAGEVKMKWTEEDLPQILRFTRTNLEQRPDQHSALGFHATKSGYLLVRVDSVGSYRTEIFAWDYRPPLVRYVRELYTAPHDKSMSRGDNSWTVEFGGVRYHSFPIYGSKPPGRRSWLAIAVDPNNLQRLVIIKDMWRDENRSYLEGELLRGIHATNTLPGVVECVAHGYVKDCPMQVLTSGAGATERRKYRVVLGQVGLPISACRTTLDFLKTCVDAVQLHRRCLQKGVLHRDFSWGNLLVRLKSGKHAAKWENPVEILHFVDSVIDESESGPRCVLTDFDHAAAWCPPEEVQSSLKFELQQKNLAQRTGTPMFVAVDFAVNEMTPDTYEKHTSTRFGAGLYAVHPRATTYAEKYNLGENSKFRGHLKAVAEWTTELKTDEDQRGDLPSPILHAPYHDMESLFWCIAWHCARSQPLLQDKPGFGTDSASKNDSSLYALFCERMLKHKVGLDRDGRADFRKDKASEWEKILHPSLRNKGLGDMLSAMGKYLSLPWQLFPGGAYPEHGHDMMTLVLLNTIAFLDEPIKLYKLPRTLPDETKQRLGLQSYRNPNRPGDKTCWTVPRDKAEDDGLSPFTPTGWEALSEVGDCQPRCAVKTEERPIVETWLQLLRDDNLWFM